MKKEYGVWGPGQLGVSLDPIMYFLCDLDLHEPQSPQEWKNGTITISGLLRSFNKSASAESNLAWACDKIGCSFLTAIVSSMWNGVEHWHDLFHFFKIEFPHVKSCPIISQPRRKLYLGTTGVFPSLLIQQSFSTPQVSVLKQAQSAQGKWRQAALPWRGEVKHAYTYTKKNYSL